MRWGCYPPVAVLIPSSRRSAGYFVIALIASSALIACGANEFGDGQRLRDSDAVDGGFFTPDTGETPVDAGPSPVDTGVTDAGGQTVNPFPNATVGRRCGTGTFDSYIVLSAVLADCTRHAQILDTWDGTPVTYARLPQTTGTVQVMATVCLNAEGCQQLPVTFDFDRWTEGTGAGGTWGFDLPNGGRAEGTFDAAWCEYDDFLPGGSTGLANDIAVDHVKVLQGTTVTIVENGEPNAVRNAPVVEGRDALVRVYVRPLADFFPRDIVARLTVDPGIGDPITLPDVRQRVTGASQEDVINSTFNFNVAGAAMTGDLEWKVELFEVSDCAAPVGDTSQARYPDDGSLVSMATESMGTTFNVVLVPVQYDADGSGRLPDLSDEQIQRYRNTMLAQYPVSELNLTVRAPFPYPNAITDSVNSWSVLLSEIYALKTADNPPANTYYYGIVRPAASFGAYCNGSCIAGLGPGSPAPGNVSRRAAIGLGYSGQGSAETFTHEIGHATGRLHAPCEAPGPDQNYPTGPTYDNGGLGVYGYNILNGSFYNPTAYSYIMGYCDPTWISDYNYAAIFERIRFANNAAMFTSWPERTIRLAVVDGDTAQWGAKPFVVRERITDPVSVQFEDAFGRVLSLETADRIKLDHGAEPLYAVPLPAPAGATQVRLPDGQVLAL